MTHIAPKKRNRPVAPRKAISSSMQQMGRRGRIMRASGSRDLAYVASRITRVLTGGGMPGKSALWALKRPFCTVLHGGPVPIQGGRECESQASDGLRPGHRATRMIAN